jgi:hypothetical protein
MGIRPITRITYPAALKESSLGVGPYDDST